ncbi:MAG: metallophosphoesterase family protein [Candidatus Heimdallarchaeota archaeon]|nr:MAG: metallophosphoesterase family protein [Candidatus Heimdallarchaeota archaeon]
MKVLGLISDTHIPSRQKTLPNLIIKSFREADVDMIIHAGDFEELSVASELEEIAPLKAVQGNMCHSSVKKRFPKRDIIQVEKVSIGLTHGSGGLAGYFERVLNEFKGVPQPEIIVSGHTHQPFANIEKNILFINPGSPTDKYFAPRNTIALLKISGKKFEHQFIEIK